MVRICNDPDRLRAADARSAVVRADSAQGLLTVLLLRHAQGGNGPVLQGELSRSRSLCLRGVWRLCRPRSTVLYVRRARVSRKTGYPSPLSLACSENTDLNQFSSASLGGAAPPRRGRFFGGITLCLAGLLAGCATNGGAPVFYGPQEKFGSVATYSRLFDATPAQTCEASRRALLSQGYLINTTTAEMVEGKKSFQPSAETHLQMVIRVVCVPDSPSGKISLGFVTALQDSYTLRKTNNSASLGVGALGSVSLPIAASSDSLVKVGSETIASDGFYESFFDLIKRYLVADDQPAEVSAGG